MSRYIVRETTGYRIILPVRPMGGQNKPMTEICVMDSWLGFEVVWSSETATYQREYTWMAPPDPKRRQYAPRRRHRLSPPLEWKRLSVAQRRAHAHELADRLNREHEDALNGCVG